MFISTAINTHNFPSIKGALFAGCFISPCYSCLLGIHCELMRLWQLKTTCLQRAGVFAVSKLGFYSLHSQSCTHHIRPPVRLFSWGRIQSMHLSWANITMFTAMFHTSMSQKQHSNNDLLVNEQGTLFKTFITMERHGCIGKTAKDLNHRKPRPSSMQLYSCVFCGMGRVLQPLQKYWVAFNQGPGGWI